MRSTIEALSAGKKSDSYGVVKEISHVKQKNPYELVVEADVRTWMLMAFLRNQDLNPLSSTVHNEIEGINHESEPLEPDGGFQYTNSQRRNILRGPR